MDFIDKAAAFFEEVEKAGINFSNLDGETAVICKDCVAVVSKSGDEVGVDFVNQVEHLDFTVGFTQKDVEDFLLLEELQGGGEDAGN